MNDSSCSSGGDVSIVGHADPSPDALRGSTGCAGSGWSTAESIKA